MLLHFLYSNFLKDSSIGRRARSTLWQRFRFCTFGCCYNFFHLFAKRFWFSEMWSAVFVFWLPFIVVYWYLIHCFTVFLIVEVFTFIIVMTRTIACIWNFFRLVVFSCLYSSWSIFYPKLKWLSSSQSSPCFVANILKSSDDSAYHFHFVSPSLKFFCICIELVEFGSNLWWLLCANSFFHILN